MKRRDLLKTFPALGALVAAPLAGQAIAAEPEAAELVAIPRETFDKIVAWQSAQRASVRASNAYSDHLREICRKCGVEGQQSVTAEEKALGDALMKAHIEAGEAVGPAREKMILALLSLRA